jgi:hypothetical protein
VTSGGEQACHELLVRLAGRLPDRLLWRLREWLATGGHAAVAALLPRALLRHRVGLTDAERELLEAAVGERSTSRRLLDAILVLREPDGPSAAFRPGPADPDTAALSLMAVVRGEPACVELRQALRGDRRVVLVRGGGDRPWALVGTLQRLLRAHGEAAPCVEVLPAESAGEPDAAAPPYHRAALAASTRLWRRPGHGPTDGEDASGSLAV